MKSFALPFAMISGALAYFFVRALPLSPFAGTVILRGVEVVQPLLIFSMLFLAFCKVPLSNLRLQRWHIPLLLFQMLTFIALVLIGQNVEQALIRISLETAVLCLICPTATAACVVTGKLGGDVAELASYIVLINLLTAILVPLFVPLISNVEDLCFSNVFAAILCRVFPVLLFPLLLAEMLRRLTPKAHAWFASRSGWAFRIWIFALALAIALTTRTIVHSKMDISLGFAIGLVSLTCCAIQFAFGRYIGKRFGSTIAASQALGQKNTIFAIWMGYTFLTPITTVAGGFYSIWHNLYNAWQLRQTPKPKNF